MPIRQHKVSLPRRCNAARALADAIREPNACELDRIREWLRRIEILLIGEVQAPQQADKTRIVAERVEKGMHFQKLQNG